MTKDLSIGKPSRILWVFCLPLFGSIVFQQLYNIADSFVAGKFIGENALAAVGNSYEITLILIAFAFGCNIGCSIVVSRLFGAKNLGEMKTAVTTSMILSTVVCLLLMIAGFVFANALLSLIHTPAELIIDSKLYLDVYLLGLPFVFFYNISNGIFTALGDSKTPFVFLACSSIANIGMDILFVKTFNMGVAGVAWATFICQGVACILALIVVVIRLRSLCGSEKSPLFSKKLLIEICRIAIPSILQQSFISVGNVMIQRVINDFGTSVMAGYAASVKLNNLVITSFTTVGNGMSNYTSQNLGAGKPKRIKEGFKAGIGMVWALCLPLTLLYFFVGEPIVRFFIDNPTPEAISTAIVFLRILSPFYFVVSLKLISDGILRGVGLMKQFMITTFTDLILRVVFAFVLSKLFNEIGIWSAWPFGWIVATVLSVIFYRFSSKSGFKNILLQE